MIKIKIDATTRLEIEKQHWNWYKNYLKKKQIPLKNNLPNGKKNVLSFLEHILNWDYSLLKKIVLAHQSELHALADKNCDIFKTYFQKKHLKIDIKQEKKDAEKWTVEKILKDYFGYDDFEKSAFPINGKKWGAYEFTRKLNVDVCPYCGRQYIFTINDGDGRPQIDHYYPQSDYPYLSCSLYNFIPSCPQCNHQKGDVLNKYATRTNMINHKEYKYDSDNRAFILYPYEDAFESEDENGTIKKFAWFSILYGEQKREYKSLDDSICVKIKKNKTLSNSKIDNSIEAFHLNELYSCHKIDITDIFTRYRNYSNPKIDEITKLFIDERINTSDLRLNKNQRDALYKKIAKTYTKRIKQTILGLPLDTKDKQYPLRKFKEDIIEQLDETAQKMRKEKT